MQAELRDLVLRHSIGRLQLRPYGNVFKFKPCRSSQCWKKDLLSLDVKSSISTPWISNSGLRWFSAQIERRHITVYTEYKIFDLSGILATVGGSLGLFIGFSFLEFMMCLINGVAPRAWFYRIEWPVPASLQWHPFACCRKRLRKPHYSSTICCTSAWMK